MVQCCSFPRQYCTRPGLRPLRPPGAPTHHEWGSPSCPDFRSGRFKIDWSVAAAIVSKWDWEDFNHPPTSPLILHLTPPSFT